MAPRKAKNKSISKKTTTVPRQEKRRCDENKTIADSPKKICYNKSSSSMEKRDKQYCTTIEKSKLKSLRVSPDDEDDEDDFGGFNKDDADDNSYWVKRKISILEFAQDILIDELTSEGQSETISIPEVAPVCKNQDVDASQDVTNVSEARKDPVGGAFPLEILDLIPDPLEISNETGNDNITYTIRENGTSSGKACIEDSHGYTYSFQKASTAKSSMFPSKFTYWQCIKRQNKDPNNCKCYIKIEKFEEGSRNMIVKRQGGHGESHSHNHTPRLCPPTKKGSK